MTNNELAGQSIAPIDFGNPYQKGYPLLKRARKEFGIDQPEIVESAREMVGSVRFAAIIGFQNDHVLTFPNGITNKKHRGIAMVKQALRDISVETFVNTAGELGLNQLPLALTDIKNPEMKRVPFDPERELLVPIAVYETNIQPTVSKEKEYAQNFFDQAMKAPYGEIYEQYGSIYSCRVGYIDRPDIQGYSELFLIGVMGESGHLRFNDLLVSILMKTKNIQRFMKIASKDIHGAFGGLLSMSLSPDLVDYYYCPEFESPEKQNLKQIGWRLKDVGYMQSAILGNNAWYHLARNEDHTFKVVEEIPVESL